MNSATSKPSYLPDGNAIIDQGSSFTQLDQYIESPFISPFGDLASEEEPEPLSFCEELQNKLKYAMGWNKKREESYQCNI